MYVCCEWEDTLDIVVVVVVVVVVCLSLDTQLVHVSKDDYIYTQQQQ